MEDKEFRIRVGVGDFEVAQHPYVLETISLGSCVGIAFYDPGLKLGGLCHIMLPNSKQSAANTSNSSKFADTGINMTLAEMERRGARRQRIIAKIAGGASMFYAAVIDNAMSVGLRNVEAVRAYLESSNIRIAGSDTGGTWGRTIVFYLDKGTVEIKSALRETIEL